MFGKSGQRGIVNQINSFSKRNKNMSGSEYGKWSEGFSYFRWEKLQCVCNNPERNYLGRVGRQKAENTKKKQELLKHFPGRR
jgi:hypothetical protein